MYIFQIFVYFKILSSKSMIFFKKNNEKEDSHLGKNWPNEMCLVIGMFMIGSFREP